MDSALHQREVKDGAQDVAAEYGGHGSRVKAVGVGEDVTGSLGSRLLPLSGGAKSAETQLAFVYVMKNAALKRRSFYNWLPALPVLLAHTVTQVLAEHRQ